MIVIWKINTNPFKDLITIFHKNHWTLLLYVCTQESLLFMVMRLWDVQPVGRPFIRTEHFFRTKEGTKINFERTNWMYFLVYFHYYVLCLLILALHYYYYDFRFADLTYTVWHNSLLYWSVIKMFPHQMRNEMT